jgi:ABC-type cobalamin transport system ATPase subunit
MPLHLIGGNNAGKSTIIDALALALRGGGMHLFTPSAFDFFHDSKGVKSQTFSISLRFSAADDLHLPAVRGVGNPVAVCGIRVDGKTDKKGDFTHQRILVDAQDKTITLSHTTPLKNDLKEAYKDHGIGYRPVNARIDDIREHIPEVWLLQPDNLRASLYEWKTGPLKRLSRLLAEKFLETNWTLNIDGQMRKMPETLVRAHKFFHSAIAEFPYWKDTLKPKLQDALSRYVGRQARIDLQPDIQTIEEWLAQQLVAAFAADAGGAATPLSTMGDGWQSLVRLACLEVLSQLPETRSERITLLFEEPETFLHPHLSRSLRATLERLADAGWMVVTTTHASELINFATSQKIVRLWRKGDEVVKGELETSSVAAEAKFQERLDEHGGHDMLFAHRVILCEGKDDTYALRSHLEKASVDLDVRSVSIIGVNGVGTLPAFAEVARRLKIPWCAVTDEDLLPDGTIKPNTSKARHKLAALRGTSDLLVEWPSSLEDCLGVTGGQKATPEWSAANLDPLDLQAIQTRFPDFHRIASVVGTWAST